jgi:hypothetical protein
LTKIGFYNAKALQTPFSLLDKDFGGLGQYWGRLEKIETLWS